MGSITCRVQLASFQGGLARVREAECDERADSHVAGTSVQHEPVDPGARAACADLQIKAGAIRVVARGYRTFDLQRIEAIDELSHPSAALQLPTNLPTSLGEIVRDGPGRHKTEEA